MEEKFPWGNNQKFVDTAQQCFAFTQQVNFPTNNLNLRWRWWDQIQTIFLNILYFIKTKIKLSSQHFKQCRNYWIGMFRCYFFCYNCSYLSKIFFCVSWFMLVYHYLDLRGTEKRNVARWLCKNGNRTEILLQLLLSKVIFKGRSTLIRTLALFSFFQSKIQILWLLNLNFMKTH